MSSFTDGSWLYSVGLAQHQPTFAAALEAIRENKINIALFVLFVIIAVRQFTSQSTAAKKAHADHQHLAAPGFPEVERLEKFNWREEEPLKLRSFRPKYFLTMGFDESAIQNLDPSDLILMDRTYADRISYRKRIMRESSDIAIGVNDDKRIGSAVRELYTYLLGTYLPKRYPDMFKLHFAQFETGRQFMFENLVTKAIYPVATSERSDTKILLQTLGAVVDEDLLFLLPEEDSEDPKYKLEAYVCICPSGWSPPEKLGKRLVAIHGPVPGYKDKLEGSMDRYFKGLEVGKYVKRSNWSITQYDQLFLPDANTNHGKEGVAVEELQSIDPEKVFLRSERQTLHRLPKSESIVFAFRTYLDSLKEIKDEGLGNELADAIDGLKSGNVPSINVYKRAPVWGTATKKYLRS